MMRQACSAWCMTLVLFGCQQTAPQPLFQSVGGEALGTTWAVQWKTADAVEEETVRAGIVQTLARLDLAMSTWRPDSEISRVRAGGKVPVSPETAMVILAGLDLAHHTHGAFDPTVQPLMELWGLHGNPRTSEPTAGEIAAAHSQVGWSRVRVEKNEGQWFVDAGGTALDLGGMAKGTGVDWIAANFEDWGITSFLIEVGGEMRLSGEGPRGTWRVGIDHPTQRNAGRPLAFVWSGSDRAVATSGNYRNQYQLEGRTIAHTMDPRTATPVSTGVLSATVVAPDCQTADGVATALMVMGYEEGRKFVESDSRLEAAWVLSSSPELILRYTPEMRAGMGMVAPGIGDHETIGVPDGNALR